MYRNENLEKLILPVLKDGHYNLVRLLMRSEGTRKVLQIMIECEDNRPITLEDCEKVSRELSAILDVNDPIDGKYSLEISSAGLDRPLVKPEDFERFKGFSAKIETDTPISGIKRFKGIITSVSANNEITVALEENKGNINIPFSSIAKAKLVITDELLRTALQEQKL